MGHVMHLPMRNLCSLEVFADRIEAIKRPRFCVYLPDTTCARIHLQVIFLNLIMIGIEAQVSLIMEEEFPPWSWPWVSERVFLLVYCILAQPFYLGLLRSDPWFEWFFVFSISPGRNPCRVLVLGRGV